MKMFSRAAAGLAGSVRSTPANISGVQAWWDAADNTKLTLSGSQVTAWNDQIAGIAMTSALGAGVVNRSSPAQMNNKPALLFNGGYLQSASTPTSINSASVTRQVFWVGYQVATVANNLGCVITICGNPGYGWGYIGSGSGAQGFASVCGSGFNMINASATIGVLAMVSWDVPAGSTQPSTIYMNGSSVTATTGGSGGFTSSTGFMRMGMRPDTTENINAYVGDVVFGISMVSSDRQKVEGYLAWKYGIQGSLPAGHPYKGGPP